MLAGAYRHGIQCHGCALQASLATHIPCHSQLDAHLFSPSELALMGGFKALPVPAQSLLLRLHLRRGPWFHLSSLAYEEVRCRRCGLTTLLGNHQAWTG